MAIQPGTGASNSRMSLRNRNRFSDRPGGQSTRPDRVHTNRRLVVTGMQFNTISHTNEIAPLLSMGRRFPSLYFFKQLLRLRTNASTSGGPIHVPLSVPRRCAATRTRGPRGGRSPAGATLFPRDPAGGRGGRKSRPGCRRLRPSATRPQQPALSSRPAFKVRQS